MRKTRLTIIIFLALIGACPGFAQFRLTDDFSTQAIREGAHCTAILVSEFDDIYLLDNKYCEIYRLDRNGALMNRNGGFGWQQGQFDQPGDLCMSGLDLVVTDRNNHRIVRYDRQLNYLSTLDLRSDELPLVYPLAITASQINELFILIGETSEIMRLFAEKNEQTRFGGIEYGQYALVRPVSLRLNGKGILAALQQDGSLVCFDRFGSPIGTIPNPAKINALGLVAIGEDWLVLTDTAPYLQMFATKSKEWRTPALDGYIARKKAFVSGTFRNDRLYLLNSSGEIVIFTIDRLNPEP